MKAIKKILAFTMVLTMLLGCFMFSTSADVTEPGATTGTLVASGTDDGANGASSDGINFSVYEDANGYHTMWFFANDPDGGGWVRPFDQVDSSSKAFWTSSFETGYGDGYTNDNAGVKAWCKANVEKIVLYSGTKSFANSVFDGYENLEYVEIGTAVTELKINRTDIFKGCTLKAIYKTGTTPAIGVADLTMVTEFGNNAGQAFNEVRGIDKVLLGNNLTIAGYGIFNGMFDLKTVMVSADSITVSGDMTTDSSKKITLVDVDYTGRNAVILCTNDTVKTQLAGYVDAPANVKKIETTYTNNEGKAYFYTVSEGEGVTMYLDATAGYNGVELWSFEADQNKWPAISELDTLKTTVTKAVVESRIASMGYGLFNNFTALTTVEIAAESLIMDRGNTFCGCSALTSVYKTGETPEAGVADLTMVTKLGQQGWGELSEFYGVTNITTVKLGDEICFGGTNPIAGSTGITKITISATDAEKITSEGLNASWVLTLPEGAVFECANEAMKNRLVEVTFIDAAKVTFPAPEPTPNENTGNENTGNENTGNENTGNQNTGNQNTGNPNTGAEDDGGDETTKAPETTAATTTDAPKSEGGCGSTIALGAVAVVAAFGACITAIKKRED